MLHHIPDIQSTSFTVIGAARSGAAAARLLDAKAATVFLSELSGEKKFARSSSMLKYLHIPHEFGGHSDRVFDATIFVLSPGVPTQAPIVQEALSRGIEVVSEIELASWFCTVPIIAITGTNGKTTTTVLTGKIFSDAGWQTIVAGNIGDAFSSFVLMPQESGVAVLEISSYQLDHIHLFHPKVAIITTITPDHLDRYEKSFENYMTSKQRICMNQTADDYLIYNSDNDATRQAAAAAHHVKKIPFSVEEPLTFGGWLDGQSLLINTNGGNEHVSDISDLIIRGAHNYANTLMASLAARVMEIPIVEIGESCRTFSGVEHRLEFVREIDGVKYINDSKATNADSVVVALRSFTEPIVLIAGGRDKGSPYDPLLDLVASKVKAIVLIGEASERMESVFEGKTQLVRASSMEDAVRRAQSLAVSGGIVLLSPACASFDMFDDYQDRGRTFKEIVSELPEIA